MSTVLQLPADEIGRGFPAENVAGPPTAPGRSSRPQTAQRSEVAEKIFRPTLVRPASHIGARSENERERAKTPPWAVKEAEDAIVSPQMLKKEYQAMKDQEVATQIFEQKLNIQRIPINVHHMQKDWRWYQHIGSKGSLWEDLHMTPAERRHLVVTPTVVRGYRQQERTLEKRVAEEEEQEALRLERTQLLRQQRRFHLQETQRRTALLQHKARQSRPGTSMSGAVRGGATASSGSRAVTSHALSEGSGSGGGAGAAEGWRVPTAAGSTMTGASGTAGGQWEGLREVGRPASQLEGRSFRRFDYTTLLSQAEWEAASRRRDATRHRTAWELERPDLHQRASQQACAKEQLEVEYERRRQARLQGQRQDRISMLQGRLEARQALERRAGQATVRERQRMTPLEVKRQCWKPSGYGAVAHAQAAARTAA